jgi:inosine/xanthosine triphosphatase
MQIHVGSTNPVKINSVINAASETWPEVEVTGFKTASGIPEQPIGDLVTRKGAQNRARAVLEIAHQEGIDKDFLGVGLEGGVFDDEEGVMWTTVWIAVIDLKGDIYHANGARFPVPEIVADRIRNNEEMGPIIAQVVGEEDIRSKQGMIGIITEGFVDRTEEYAGITKMALGLWHGRNWLKNL